jgi:hypothetical protein
MISVGFDDAAGVEAVSFWMANDAPRSDDRVEDSAGHLLPLTGAVGEEWGGTKPPFSTVWAGVGNYLDSAALLAFVNGVSWRDPDAVQVFVREEEDDYFAVYMLRDGALTRLTP